MSKLGIILRVKLFNNIYQFRIMLLIILTQLFNITKLILRLDRLISEEQKNERHPLELKR